MAESTTFEQAMADGYGFDGPSLTLGVPMLDGRTLPGVPIRLPLAMLNRHGLVAGATGTGKTKTLQVLAEQLSEAGVPVFVSDIKGDISGLGAPAVLNDRISARNAAVGHADHAPTAFPVEFLTLVREGRGVRLRASVESFGPILLAKVLELNETQQSVLAMAFKYAEDRKLPLIDLDDLRTLLNLLNSDQGKALMAQYGGVATATVGVILRKIVEVEQQDADSFFGHPEFAVDHLLRITPAGQGIISILELADMQDRPVLFSTFMMWLLARLYEELPEIGDPERPKLVFFFDEAHLLFRDANPSFLNQIQLVARLIRSKGVGVFFVTHAPADVPSEVLTQLGNRVQHALRAFTPDDLEVVRATARTFPVTTYYDVEQELTRLGTGEALVTGLNADGVPMPTARTMMRAPRSLMGQLDGAGFDRIVAASELVASYAADVDPISADEILGRRLARHRRGGLEWADPDAKPQPVFANQEAAGPKAYRSTQPPERARGIGLRASVARTIQRLLRIGPRRRRP